VDSAEAPQSLYRVNYEGRNHIYYADRILFLS